MMKLIVSWTIRMSLLLVVPGGGEAGAASCASCPHMGQGSPCQEYWRADAVFVGRVTAVDAKDWSGTNLAPYSEYMRMTARLAIEEAFRGVDEVGCKEWTPRTEGLSIPILEVYTWSSYRNRFIRASTARKRC